MALERIMVVGAGQMGSGIAQVAAQAGCRVWLRDLTAELVEKGLGGIRKFLDRGVEKGKVSPEEREAVLGRITGTVDAAPAAECDLVIEAVVEDLAVKNKVFAELDGVCPPATIFASNTSSLPITQMAAATRRPDRFIGMHFMNPVPLMKLVEIIRGIATDVPTYERAVTFAQSLGKITSNAEDFPAFIVNRILLPMINEAIYTLYEGVGTVDAIDTAMKLGANHPMGPLELGDFIGLDTVLSIMNVLHEGLADSKYRPCPLLVKYVEAGWLGKKAGRGFYDYRGETPVP
ncbi:MAG: 3-hydroxybutyryl-CoA dehydrogenase, partial [Firmicutes bacterium]|nr:3-hydroxybutyryl-CoA dehydrogenase [Bacillota bacterium]